ncbi:MAG: hypothetical protein ACOYJ8_02145 [Patescibacteria group bacterium]|jgi:membrane-associated HD superfamily phosphohydrolase
MKKIILISVTMIALLIVPTMVLAQLGQQGQGSQQQDRVQDPATHEEVIVAPEGNQVQNQVKTQNAGEDSQLNVNTQENLQADEDSQGRSDIARQNMSSVAQKVEELLENEGAQGGIGQQVKTIAQQQKQAQGEIGNQLEKLESRQGLMKRLFGADQKAIKNLKQQIEQNQQRIRELQELQNQVINQAEEAQVQELVQALVSQNTALEEQVQTEEKITGVLGWLLKLFS